MLNAFLILFSDIFHNTFLHFIKIMPSKSDKDIFTKLLLSASSGSFDISI